MSSSRLPILAVFAVLLAGAVAFVVLGRGGDGDGEAESSVLPDGCEAVEAPEPREENLRPPKGPDPSGPLQATLETSCGEIVIDLDTERSPKTVGSFVQMAEEGVYDDNIFSRIVPGFVIQTGDPTQTGAGDAGYSVDEPPPANAEYTTGTVAMAKSGVDPPGRSGSQFFIVSAPADAGLPPDYAIVGEVADEASLEVVERIDSLGDPASGQTGTPLETVVLESVSIES